MSGIRRARRFEMVDLTGRGARWVMWFYVLSTVVLALWTLDGVRNPYPTLVGLVLFAVVAVVVTRDRGDRMSLTATFIVIAVGVINTALISWQLIYLGYTQWYFGSATVALFYVCLRGRIVLAWLGFLPLAVVLAIWGATTEIGFFGALELVARQTPILIVGTLFATGLRRTGDAIDTFTAESSERAVAEAASLATTRERENRLTVLGQLAAPLLERIAHGTAPSRADRLEYSLAEAELRDGLRARSLLLPGVIAEARAARRRGVEVVLLDDSDPSLLPAEDLQRAADAIESALEQAKDGRLTARLLPPRRDAIATIVVDGSEHRSTQVAR